MELVEECVCYLGTTLTSHVSPRHFKGADELNAGCWPEWRARAPRCIMILCSLRRARTDLFSSWHSLSLSLAGRAGLFGRYRRGRKKEGTALSGLAKVEEQKN